MAEGDHTTILHLFNRPAEPVYIAKGDSKVAFDIPESYLPERYRNVAPQVINRFQDDADSRIPVNPISLPDLSVPKQLGRHEAFSLFIPRHRELAGRLIKIFMGMRTYDDLLAVAVYSRDCLNPNMFIYALSVALLHREDTKHLPLPSLAETFPDKYVDSLTSARAKEEAEIVPAGSRMPIDIPRDYTASDLDEEHRVAYWREDVGINLHHWHWHLVYPFDGDRSIVAKDRRGELFYYMHQQIMARYNTERLCNHLGRVKRFNNIRDPIPEGYFPKLDAHVAGKTWPSRPSGAQLKDINRPADQVVFDLHTLERWRDSIYNAIHTGTVVSSVGQEKIPLTEKNGIDILGNMMEASILSPNPNLYGDLHNFGHVAISFCHDPDNRYLESFGIMGDSATAMRDPIFYRWHAFMNDIFMEHKNLLPEYNVSQLNYPGIEMSGIELITPNAPSNSLMTFWTQSDLDLSRGLDFAPSGPILVRFTHLNHTNFRYRITANNLSNTTQKGTVRIFIGPKMDERGLAFSFRAQKDLMIEMDKFTVSLHPGQNTIERASTQSSVTIPFGRTFRNLDNNRPIGSALEQFNFCGCGWPQHMLVPKGTKEGFPMDLFVMISDFKDDVIQQPSPEGCSDASSFCGLRDRKYPDARAMGYPFDRRPRAGVEILEHFLTPNMAVTEVRVRYTDTVKPKTAN